MSAHVSQRFVLFATLLIAATFAAGCEMLGDSAEDDAPTITDVTVPKESELVAQGRGELSYKARADGRIFLHDATADKTLFATPVQRGQRFTTAPGEDRASLDGTDAFEGDMQTRNEHKVYFLPKK